MHFQNHKPSNVNQIVSFEIHKTHNHFPTRRFEFTLFRITLKYVICSPQNTQSLSNASFVVRKTHNHFPTRRL